jgi:hypothetical protein
VVLVLVKVTVVPVGTELSEVLELPLVAVVWLVVVLLEVWVVPVGVCVISGPDDIVFEVALERVELSVLTSVLEAVEVPPVESVVPVV